MFSRSFALVTAFTMLIGVQIAPTVASSAPSATTSTAVLASRGPALPDAGGSQGTMTFQAWKGLRLEEARLVLERLTLESQVDRMAVIDRSPGEKQAVVKSTAAPTAPEIAPIRTASMRVTKTGNRSDRIEQAQINLEIAQELTMNDYLQIYLSRFRSREVLLDVARRMSPDEIVDLVLAHQKLSSGAQIAEHSTAPRLLPARSN